MNQNLRTKLLVVLAAGIAIVGCGRTSGPMAPSSTGVANASVGELVLRGSVSGETDLGMNGLEGVTVTVSNGAASVSTSTDAAGEFTVSGLSAGGWTVTVSRAGYVDETISVNLEGDTSLGFSLDREDATVTSKRSARIHGK
jgi:hypothetical protein